MTDFTAKRIDDMEGLYGGAMRRVRAELGLASFGVQTVDLPPNFDGYPWHDHADDGQEELYAALRGEATLELDDGQTVPLAPGETVVRVASGTKRRVVTGAEPVRLLIVGGVPSTAYAPPPHTELGAPDPAAS
jgi:uncharacterized cupin superfamily protein